jgi:hypothetical protein
MSATEKKTPAVAIIFAWLVVGAPLAWGVSQTWKNAAKLFSAPPPTPAATQASPAKK